MEVVHMTEDLACNQISHKLLISEANEMIAEQLKEISSLKKENRKLKDQWVEHEEHILFYRTRIRHLDIELDILMGHYLQKVED
jgi:hypothetical protein